MPLPWAALCWSIQPCRMRISIARGHRRKCRGQNQRWRSIDTPAVAILVGVAVAAALPGAIVGEGMLAGGIAVVARLTPVPASVVVTVPGQLTAVVATG